MLTDPVEIFNDRQRDGLRYIEAANSGGYQPTAGEVQEWVFKRDRRPARRGPLIEPSKPSPMRQALEQVIAPRVGYTSELAKTLGMLTDRTTGRTMAELGKFAFTPPPWSDFVRTPAKYGPGKPAESYVDHMIRLGWLRLGAAGGLLLAPLGKALLRDDSLNDGDTDAVVVLEPGSDLAYPQLIGHIADSGEAYVIDPYAMADHVWQLIKQTATSRVLIGPYVKPKKLAELRVLLGMATRQIQVRQADAGVLHDRFIIGDRGVHTVGASWNSVGKSLTLLSPVPQVAADRIIDLAEQWWEEASVVEPSEPRPVAEVDTEAPTEANS